LKKNLHKKGLAEWLSSSPSTSKKKKKKKKEEAKNQPNNNKETKTGLVEWHKW
jgi:hypothetical protein